jgi:hypothetical protein
LKFLLTGNKGPLQDHRSLWRGEVKALE